MNKEFVNGFKTGFKDFGESVKKTVNYVFLLIAYLIGVGISSLLFRRLAGKEFLPLKIKKESNWTEEEIGTEDKEQYYRQF